MIILPLRVELGESVTAGQRWASIMLGDVTIFAELVFDNDKHSAEQNIVTLFAERLRRVVEGDV